MSLHTYNFSISGPVKRINAVEDHQKKKKKKVNQPDENDAITLPYLRHQHTALPYFSRSEPYPSICMFVAQWKSGGADLGWEVSFDMQLPMLWRTVSLEYIVSRK